MLSHVVTSQFVLLFRVIEYIFSEVDKHIEAGNLISEYKMSALPSLYDLFVKLIKFLVSFQSPVLSNFFHCHFVDIFTHPIFVADELGNIELKLIFLKFNS